MEGGRGSSDGEEDENNEARRRFPAEQDDQEEEESDGDENIALPVAPVPVQAPIHVPGLMDWYARQVDLTVKRKGPQRVPRRENIFECALLSRNSEIAALAYAALPDAAAGIGRHMWRVILSMLDSKSFVATRATCWFLREVGSDDAIWEALFASEVGGVSLVPMRCSSWQQRFSHCQKMPHLPGALNSAIDGDEIILCPGIYDDAEFNDFKKNLEGDHEGDFPLEVTKSVHLIGCSFNRRYAAQLNWHHPEEVTLPSTEGNIVIQSSCSNALIWNAGGGSISDLEIVSISPNSFEPLTALIVTEGEKLSLLELHIVGFRSSHCGLHVEPGCRVLATECRFYKSPESAAVTVLRTASLELRRCVLDGNRA